MADLRILVIADDPLARAGLASLLAEQSGCTVVGRASGLDDLPAMVEVYRPDVLLWDMSWQPDSAIERLALLVERTPPVAVLLPDDRSRCRSLVRRRAGNPAPRCRSCTGRGSPECPDARFGSGRRQLCRSPGPPRRAVDAEALG